MKLLSQCNSYRQLISKIAAGRENFLVDLVRALKKITEEWKNWKHQSYGKLQTRAYVSAVEQVNVKKKIRNITPHKSLLSD